MSLLKLAGFACQRRVDCSLQVGHLLKTPHWQMNALI
jgi:hypothetical protein